MGVESQHYCAPGDQWGKMERDRKVEGVEEERTRKGEGGGKGKLCRQSSFKIWCLCVFYTLIFDIMILTVNIIYNIMIT